MRIEDKVYELVSQVPRGKVTTYGDLARALGDIRAVRAVGKILRANPRPIEVPCHRVVMGDGGLGGYIYGVDRKLELLKSEGIEFSTESRVKNFQDVRFTSFKTDYPLVELRSVQESMKRLIIVEDEFGDIKTVGGVDVAYSNARAVGGYVCFDYRTGAVTDEAVLSSSVEFPYIPTYLAFREAPIIESVIRGLSELPTVLMIDGNGTLHPHRLGIASHVGVQLDVPTIGVAKSLLCGEMMHFPRKEGEAVKILYEGRLVGYGLKSSRSSRLIYISPGHKISMGTALTVVKRFCRFRVPEPIRRAHLIATQALKSVSNHKQTFI